MSRGVFSVLVSVALYARAWVEIIAGVALSAMAVVALYARAWVEIPCA